MTNFLINNTPIEGVKLGQIQSKADERGYFERVYCWKEYEELAGCSLQIKQINRSMSKVRGTTRGLHFQWPPRAETKIVSCAAGSLFDVAVDLRVGSLTYLQYFAAELTAENKQFLIIPEGFGHGFQTLEPNTEILYLVTEEFSVQHDDGINPDDPAVGVKWPLEIALRSQKDTERKYIADRAFKGIDVAQRKDI
ncbi:MAG: dTDP-4-dehydrorhamnose 3,5-epimerase family protein [Marinibacterium sp.]|nr:dTDP-4-dehydrorhamnose 3,5-epimerase family protein [Marinibacterium sp.]